MKKCSQCGREYDNSMSFCLDDGVELLYGPTSSDEPATETLRSDPSQEAPTRAQFHTTDQSTTPAAKEEHVDERPSRRSTALIIGIVAVLLIGAFLGYRYLRADGDPDQIHSIAVLPLENRSGNAD